MAYDIPALPTGSWPIYTAVEEFLIQVRRDDDAFSPTVEELGHLSLLISDMQSDIRHLEDLAGFVARVVVSIYGKEYVDYVADETLVWHVEPPDEDDPRPAAWWRLVLDRRAGVPPIG